MSAGIPGRGRPGRGGWSRSRLRAAVRHLGPGRRVRGGSPGWGGSRWPGDRVDTLALAVAPDDVIAIEAGEHRANVEQAVGEGLLEAHAVGDHAPPGDLVQPFGG